MPEFKQFLENAIAQNRTNVGLKIITNATNINLNYQNLLDAFPDKEFIVSIDGHDLVNRYIRWPSNWETLVANVHRLYEITDRVSFNVTVSMWNISNLSKLILFLEKEFDRPLIFLNEAVPNGRANISPFNRPDLDIVLADLEKLKTCVSYQTEDHFRNKVDYFLSKMQNSKFDINILRNFFKYNDQLDSSRNIELENFIPELHACKGYL
jgi:sulfatase maturation enzyme AslB (radical SAM superfamily)